MNFDIADLDFGLLNILSRISVLWAVGVGILKILINILFAIAVYRDATRLDRTRALIIVGPGIWCIATLLGGVITAAIYWAMHHSRLNPDIPMASTETEEA